MIYPMITLLSPLVTVRGSPCEWSWERYGHTIRLGCGGDTGKVRGLIYRCVTGEMQTDQNHVAAK